MNYLKKIHNDLLLTPSGKYSRKSFSWFFSVITSSVILINGLISNNWPPEYIWFGLLGYGFGMGALSVYQKKQEMGHGYYNNYGNTTIYSPTREEREKMFD